MRGIFGRTLIGAFVAMVLMASTLAGAEDLIPAKRLAISTMVVVFGLSLWLGLSWKILAAQGALMGVGAAFILTRPLGAVVGDFLDKPVSAGGLALSRYSASAALLTFIVVAILLFRQRAARTAH